MKPAALSVLLNLLFLSAGCISGPKYPLSDHYDGAHFFNPSHPDKGHGLWDTLRFALGTHFETWPKRVENHPALALNRTLSDDEVNVTFVNHATVLVQTKNFTFLTDPVWSERASPFAWLGPKRHRDPGVAMAELPPIDFIIVSHNHYDHLDLRSLKQLSEKFHPRIFVPLGDREFLESEGITNVHELDWWMAQDLKNGAKITLTPSDHFSARGAFDKNKTLWGSYMVSFGRHRIYFGGDSGYGDHFKEIRARLGSPDLAFLPIGAYEPRWFMKLVHMNPDEAVRAHQDLGAAQSVGIHFGTFQLTSEKIDAPLDGLRVALENRHVPSETFVTLGEGQSHVFELGRK